MMADFGILLGAILEMGGLDIEKTEITIFQALLFVAENIKLKNLYLQLEIYSLMF